MAVALRCDEAPGARSRRHDNPRRLSLPLHHSGRCHDTDADMAESSGSFMPRGKEGEFARFNVVVGEHVTAMVAGRLDAARAAEKMHRDLTRAVF